MILSVHIRVKLVMRSLTTFQQAAIDADGTRPIYLIDLTMGSVERLSTGGDVTVGGISYTGADVNISSARDWMAAKIQLIKTATRAGQIYDGSWERAPCKISMLFATYLPMLIDPSYVNDDYFEQGSETGEPLLLLDGAVTNVSITDRVNLEITHSAMIGLFTPRTRITSALLKHLPQAGTKFVWQDETYILESR